MIVYTIEDVADILKVSVYTVRNYIKDGKIKAIKNMGSIRVSEGELNKFIEKE